MADKKDKKLLAEWFWIDRWMGSSAFLLPMEARGLYREMLTQAWRRGGRLPNDHEAIQRAIGATKKEWDRSWPKVSRFWQQEGDYLTNETQLIVYAACMAEQNGKQTRAKAGAGARWGSSSNAQAYAQASARHDSSSAQAVPEQCPPDLDLTPEDIDQNEERSDLAKPHPVRDLLAEHDRLFVARYGHKPAKYSGKDAKHAKDLVDQHGFDEACVMLRAFFGSRDPFIAQCGHGLGPLASGTVQNKLIAEMSGLKPMGDGLDGIREFARHG